MKHLVPVFAFLLFTLGHAGAAPVQTDLLKLHWSAGGGEPDKTTIKLAQGGGSWTATVNNLKDNRGETYPHVSVDLGGAQDWRGFATLKCRVRITSELPALMEGGKDFAFAFNNASPTPDANEGSMEQLLHRQVAAGDWQDLTIDLRPYGRGEISSVDIHFYVHPYGVTHEFKVEMSRCELVKEENLFDGEGMSAPLTGGGSTAVQTLSTKSGFALGLGQDGSVAGLSAGGKDLGNSSGAGGILVRDHASDAPPVPAGGTLHADQGVVTQKADLAGLGLHVEGRYEAVGDMIHVTMKAANLTKENRFLTLYFAVPLAKQAWNWHDNIFLTTPVVGGTRGYEETTNLYPLAAMTGPDGGVALAIPLDQPRNYRLAYNETTGILFVAFDVALSDIPSAAGGSLNEATCEAYLYGCDPQWGMRSALQKYYDAFPQWFANRMKQNGGWDWARLRKDLTPEQIVASGVRLDWGAWPGDSWKWNREHGILNTIYLEADYIQLSLTDLPPSAAAALDRIKKLAAGDDAEWALYSKLSYAHSGSGNTVARKEPKEHHRLLAQAILGSGLVDAAGKPFLNLGYRADWIGENGLSVMVPCNLDPLIPHGRGQFALDLYATIDTMLQEDVKTAPDGWALDSWQCDDLFDYRAENFQYSPFPLTFETGQKQMAVPIRLTMAAWVHALADWGRPKGKVVFPNLIGNFTFCTPYIDAFGTESGRVINPAYQRALAYRRTVTYLPYTPKADLDVYFNLLYAAYPGRGLVQAQYDAIVPLLDLLNAAGWEPVTGVTTGAPRLRVERYGSGPGCYLVFHNDDTSPAHGKIALDADGLKGDFHSAKVLFGPQKGHDIAIGNGGFSLTLGSHETCVVRLD
jgi:hypothetical protein